MLSRPQAEDRYDVIVVGGGSAGVAAATGAAQPGARTLLVEACGFLGGAATQSLVLAWCGFYPQRPGAKPQPVVGGVAQQALAQLSALGIDVEPYYSATGNWNIRLNPEATKIALDRTVAASGAQVVHHTKLVGACVSDGRIEAVRLCDQRGVREIAADEFVDTSGDACLAFLAGASPCPLQGSSGTLQPASYPVRISGVAPGVVLEKPARAAALAGIGRQEGRAALRADGGIMTTIPGTDDLWWLAIEVETNGLDGADLALAERDGRALAWRGVEALRGALAGFAGANISATGPRIGIRETRRTAAHAPLREAVLVAGLRADDTVALGGWPMEIHHGKGRTEYRPIGGDGVYGVPVGALVARGFENLWLGGRTAGADPAAYASVRVMGTAFATGHAAGVAAAMRGAGADRIRAELARQGAVL